tara:strand:+ start:538 stop:1068 length:531 start_codon:yes stop_codon:yes gene_type:complete
MANQTKSVLKGYFETGDTPSQAQYADLIDSQLNLSETTAQTIVGPTIFTSGVTASAGITSSGTINCGLIQATKIKDADLTNGRVTFAGVDGVLADDGDLTFSVDTLTVTKIANVNSVSHVTASGNISASFTSTGSFGSAMLTNLPTVEPLVSGALWLSGSGGGSASGSKYLMVFNG